MSASPSGAFPNAVPSTSVDASPKRRTELAAAPLAALLALLLVPRGRCGVLACSARIAVPSLFVLVVIVVGAFVTGFAEASGRVPNDAAMTSIAFAAALGLLILVPMWIAACVQRLHDLGMSGWWLPLTLLPYVGPAFGLYVTLAPGRRGPNRFGAWRAPSEFERVMGLVSLGSALLMLAAVGALVFLG